MLKTTLDIYLAGSEGCLPHLLCHLLGDQLSATEWMKYCKNRNRNRNAHRTEATPYTMETCDFQASTN